MTSSLFRKGANHALSGLALVGVLCIVITVAGLLFDVRALVFKSGSMSPAIETGALALTRPVDAKDLKVGDIVSVPVHDSRVTHRVQEISMHGDKAALSLKGDANTVADAEPYKVDSADRVFLDVPYLGYVVTWLSGPLGLFLGGMLAAGLLFLMFRPSGGDDRAEQVGSRRRKHVARRASLNATTVLLVAGAAVACGVKLAPTATMAAWSDTGSVRSGALTAITVPGPTAPTCVTNGLLLTTATVGWTSAGANYSYRLDVRKEGETTIRQTDTTTASSFTYAVTLLSGLLSSNLVVTVRAFPTGAPKWLSTATVTKNLRVKTLALGVECRA